MVIPHFLFTFGTKFDTLMEKKLKVLTILSFFLMFGSFISKAQTYEQMWKSVEKYDSDDLPKQVISEAEKIFDKAEREHNYVQMLKSWKILVEKQSDIDPEVFASLIDATDGNAGQSGSDKDKSKDKDNDNARKRTIAKPAEGTANAAVYHAILGSAYHAMIASGINDFDEDTRERYRELADEHIRQSLADKQLLASTSAEDYYPLMAQGKDSRLYDNCLLQVIMDFATNYLNDEEEITQLEECAAIYKEKGNLNAYALATAKALNRRHYPYNNKHRLSEADYEKQLQALLEEVKNEEAGCDIAIELYDDCLSQTKGNDERMAFIRWALAQYPNHVRINHFKAWESELLAAECSIVVTKSGNNGILANRPFSVTAATKNMTELNLQVRKYDGRNDRGQLKDTGTLIKEYKLPVAQDQENTKRRADRLVTGDTLHQEMTLPVGHYVFIAKGNGCSDINDFNVTTMQLFTLPLNLGKSSIAIIADKETGRPVTDAKLILGDNDIKNDITIPVDNNGEATYDSKKYIFVGATRGKDDEIEKTYCASGDISYRGNNAMQLHTQLFTDRSIYRPGQTVHLYGVAYWQEGDETKVAPNYTTTLAFYDANRQEISEIEVRTNDRGSFDADFNIPKDRMPGSYIIRANNGSVVRIQVEEYKRPTFVIDIHADSTANAKQGDDRGYSFGDTLPVIVNAKTYSGVAVQGATVSYKIEHSAASFWSSAGDWDELASGELTTDDEGNVTIPMFLDNSKLREATDASDGTPRYNAVSFKVSVDVTDLAGETHSDVFRFKLSDVAFSLDIDIKTDSREFADKIDNLPTTMDAQFDLATPHSITFKATDITSHKVDAQGTYEIFRYDKIDKEPEVKGTFTANQPTPLPYLAPGTYIIKACAYDKKQHKIVAQTEINVYDSSKLTALGSKSHSAESHFENTRLFSRSLTFSQTQDAHLYYAPADDDVYVFYYILKDDKVVKSERLTLGRSVYDIAIKYNKEYGDGVEIGLFYVKNGKVSQCNAKIMHEQPEKKLKLSWSTFRDKLQPGQQEEWILNVRDKDGKAISGAELLAAMYDSSLDDIQSHDWFWTVSFPRHIGSHYLSFNRPKLLSLNLHQDLGRHSFYIREYNSLAEYFHERYFRRAKVMTLRGAATMNFASVGGALQGRISGLDITSTAESPKRANAPVAMMLSEVSLESLDDSNDTAPTKSVIRTNFNETAFFMPHLTTDSEGNAHIAFTLPESLTEWKFMGLAHTDDMDYGSITEKIVAQKQFMVQPNMPRFVREGDHVSIVTRIINQSDNTQDGKAVIRIINPETDELVFSDTKPFTLEAGKTASVGFEFDAPDQYPMLVCEITGASSDYSDGERNYLPVLTSKRHLTETQPFYIRPAEDAEPKENSITVDLTSLFNHNSATATQKRLSFEYTARPEWTVIEALEGISLPKDDDAISYSASLYANTVAERIANSVPGLREAVAKGIERGNAKTSEISDDQELKDILMKESPWVLEAMSEADQRAAIIDLFNEHLMAGRIEKAQSKLISMQKGDGSWGWFKDMSGSYYVTLTVATNLARLGADNPLKSQLIKALNYLDAKELELFNDRKKHHYDMTPRNSTIQYMELYTMMPERRPSKDVSKMIETYLSIVEKDVKNLTIYGRANVSNLLRHFGHTKSADKFMQSVIEYSTTKPGMGRYFATDNAYYSWLDYKIPTQIAAMKALRDKHPELLPDMQLWLLRQKQTQTWDNPINTVEAIDFLNIRSGAIIPANGQWSTADGPKVTFAGHQAVTFPVDTTKFLAEQLGYVKQVIAPEVYANGLTTMEVKSQPQGLISWGAVYAQCLDRLDRVQASSSGELSVSTRIIEGGDNGNKVAKDMTELHVGDKVTIRVTIKADRDMDFVQVRCQHPACFEPSVQQSGFQWMGGRGGYVARHDASTDIFFDRFTKGTTTYDIPFTVTRTGTYQSGIATVQCAYAPEFAGHSAGSTVIVK